MGYELIIGYISTHLMQQGCKYRKHFIVILNES